MFAHVLAHQGGWDEILLIAGPMAVIVLLLWLVKRRVERRTPPDGPAAPPMRDRDATLDGPNPPL